MWRKSDLEMESEQSIFNGKKIVEMTGTVINFSQEVLIVRESQDETLLKSAVKGYQYLYDDAISICVINVFHRLLTYPKIAQADSLILNHWGGRGGDAQDLSDFIGLIIAHADHFESLTAIYIGGDFPLDDDFWPMDMADIHLTDIAYLIGFMPKLEYVHVQGASNWSDEGGGIISEPLNHRSLKKLIIESCKIDGKTIESLAGSQLPALEHLELWSGDHERFYCAPISWSRPIRALLSQPFPSLRYLGFRNSSLADDFAACLAQTKPINQLDYLDLSLGNLSDKGAKALLESPYLDRLKGLNISHHFVSKRFVRALKVRMEAHGGHLLDKNDYDSLDQENEYRFIFIPE